MTVWLIARTIKKIVNRREPIIKPQVMDRMLQRLAEMSAIKTDAVEITSVVFLWLVPMKRNK
jgi:hypothetical protein